MNNIFLFAGVIAVLWLSTASVSSATEPQATQTPQPNALGYAGIYDLRKTDTSLTGSGVNFAVICRSMTYLNGEPQNDYQPNVKHNCFKDTKLTFEDEGEIPAGISQHSTAICSILFGDDSAGYHPELGQFKYSGVAPQAGAKVYEFWHFLINNVFEQSRPEADVITASFGNPFQDWWTRGIESLAQQYGLVVVAGIGNGSDAHDSLLYPAAGSNIIGVGVVDPVNADKLSITLSNFALAQPDHSSTGPTGDNRCKPDIVAPGNSLAADNNDPNRYETMGSWSSFSTPIVAGTAGLLIQKAKAVPELKAALSTNSGNCAIKAILLNSAKKLPYWHKGRVGKDDDHTAVLDYAQGAGLLDAVGAYKQLIAGVHRPGTCPTIGWDLNQFQKSQKSEHVYKISITEPADKFITATAVWNRHFENTYPFESLPEKDANLRLEIWAVDSDDPNNDYMLDYSDSLEDNLEHIYYPADANFTDYEIIISYSDTGNENKLDIPHRYALAWNIAKKQNTESILWYDLNADGIVNELDLGIMFEGILANMQKDESYLLGDINADGTIDAEDMKLLLEHNNLKAEWYTAEPNGPE